MIKKEDLKAGMRVLLPTGARGTVFDVYSCAATIRRDDGLTGSGSSITGYGNGWKADLISGSFDLSLIDNEGEKTTIQEADTIFNVGDSVKEVYDDRREYFGVVVRVLNTCVVIRRKDMVSEWVCNKKDDGTYGSDMNKGYLINLTKGKTILKVT